jgi:hypothetical protein
MTLAPQLYCFVHVHSSLTEYKTLSFCFLMATSPFTSSWWACYALQQNNLQEKGTLIEPWLNFKELTQLTWTYGVWNFVTCFCLMWCCKVVRKESWESGHTIQFYTWYNVAKNLSPVASSSKKTRIYIYISQEVIHLTTC